MLPNKHTFTKRKSLMKKVVHTYLQHRLPENSSNVSVLMFPLSQNTDTEILIDSPCLFLQHQTAHAEPEKSVLQRDANIKPDYFEGTNSSTKRN